MGILAKGKVSIVLICFSACCAVLVQAQEASGSISGYITCNDGNFPARGAAVELIPLGSLLPGTPGNSAARHAVTTTDFSGEYELLSVEPGTYILNATFDGYSDDLKLARSVLEHSSVDDRKSLLAAFPQVIIKPASAARQDLVLRRAASISGRVSVDLGGTAGQRSVKATLVSGGTVGTSSSDAQSKSIAYSQSALTDDRGYYRIAGLPSGSYRVSVVLSQSFFGLKSGGRASVIIEPQRSGIAELTVFAPDALDEAASKQFEVKEGDEIADADITVPARLLHSIGGAVTQGGAPLGGIDVSLQRKDGAVQGSESITMPDGDYRFDLLPPGTYIIRAKAVATSGSSQRPLLGQVTIQLNDTDVLDANLDIRAQPVGDQ